MITEIELFNWKCFDHLKVSLTYGVNFITGPNGIGKSSVLQAIGATFTGRVPDGLELKNLIRRGSESASIHLAFERGDELLHVQRNLSLRGRERCFVLDSKGKEVFAAGWDEVTDYVQQLFRIRTLLFNELFFMSEGDVYRTIHEPPGKQLLDEIDRLLGIEHLQSLAKEVGMAKNEFQEEFTRHIETLQNTKTRMQPRETRSFLEDRLTELQNSKASKKAELDRLTTELWECRDRLRQSNDLLKDLLMVEQEEKSLSREKERTEPLRKQLEEILTEIDKTKRDKLKTEADVANFSKIVDVLGEKKQAEETSVKCPVCRRPISAHEMDEIRTETMNRMRLDEKKIADFTGKLEWLETKRRNLDIELKSLEEREMRVRITREKLKDERMKITEVQQKIAETTNKIDSLENKIAEYEKSLKQTEIEMGDIREKLGRIESIDLYESGVDNALVIASRGRYLSDFTLEGLEELILKQRDSRLREKLYSNISGVWNSFRGERGWTVRLDQSALPSVQLDSQVYPFQSLSAGEKTALLIVTRTMLSSLFSKDVDFLMLDEPLEHLDSRNRHSLLQFLVDALKEKLVRQLIVTTTEYSLLRKFVDYQGVRIIALNNLGRT
jgi:DNA repair exonuclease SbcCD ATPase subunit